MRKIEELSYWRYTRLKACQLSGAFPAAVASTFKTSASTGRAQIVGNVFHTMMEFVHDLDSRTELTGARLREEFNRVVEGHAKKIRDKPELAFLGDPMQWEEMASVYRGLSDLQRRRATSASDRSVTVRFEETLHSNDRLLFGQVDAFFLNPAGVDLVDC